MTLFFIINKREILTIWLLNDWTKALTSSGCVPRTDLQQKYISDKKKYIEIIIIKWTHSLTFLFNATST